MIPRNKKRNFWLGTAIVVGACLLWMGSSVSSAQSAEEGAHREWRRDIARSDFHCGDTVCHTDTITIPFAANSIAIQAGFFDELRVRFKEDGMWSDWNSYKGESDVPDGEKDARPYVQLFFHQAQALQIQTRGGNDYISVTALSVPKSTEGSLGRVHMAADQMLQAPHIASAVSRSSWLDPGIELPASKQDTLWGKDYAQVKKFIVHHTATVIRDANNDGAITSDDYKEAVRAIYVYHTYSRGWGDIGYNYIIDPDGSIWEGRAGGDGVVAGHARRSAACTKFGVPNIGFNDGTIGIAFLGTYDEGGISIAAYDALVRLIAQKSWEFNIDPADTGFFKDRIYPNILAHRDVDCTDCPGTTVYAGLPDIIRAAKNTYDSLVVSTPRRIAAEFVDSEPARIEMKPGESKDIVVRFRNTGTVAWRNYGEEKLVLAREDITKHMAAIDSVHIATVDEDAKDVNLEGVQPQPKDFFVATLASPNVEPGAIGAFTMHIAKAPSQYHSTEKFVLATGERGWLAGTEASFEILNTGLDYAAENMSDGHTVVPDDEHVRIPVRFINRGIKEWKRGDVTLNVSSAYGGPTLLKEKSWKTPYGGFLFEEKSVVSGGVATFFIPVNSSSIGEVPLNFELMVGKEKISGSDGKTMVISVEPSYKVEVVATIPRIVQNTWRPTVSMRIKNVGAKELKGAQLLAFAGDKKTPGSFYDSSWTSKTVIDTITAKPGKTVTILFKMKPPKKAGDYDIYFMVRQGKKDVYVSAADGLTKEVKQSILVDEVKKVTTKIVKKK